MLAAVPAWRRVLPFALAAGLIAFVLSRLDLDAFVDHVRRIDHLPFIGVAAVFLVALLAADAHATAWTYRRLLGPIRWRDMFVLRGASYLPSMLNHHVGQAWLTWQLSHVYGGRAQLWRAAGATLLCYASILACQAVMAVVSLAIAPGRFGWLAPTLAGIGAAAAIYLIVIWRRPAALARHKLTSPLLDAGVGGHLLATLHRLPHTIVLLIGSWVSLRFFDVNLPIADALVLFPPVLIVAALPITPQGIGTRDAISIQLFAAYAVGATDAERAAAVAAATLSWTVVVLLLEIPLSLVLLRRVLRRQEQRG